MRLHHVATTSASHENADRFYEEILGLRKMKTSVLSEDFAQRLFDNTWECQIILYGNEDLAIEVFVPVSTPGKLRSFAHLCLAVEDREELLSQCESKGLGVRRVSKGDSLVTFVEDYDGNLFEIKESSSQ